VDRGRSELLDGPDRVALVLGQVASFEGDQRCDVEGRGDGDEEGGVEWFDAVAEGVVTGVPPER